MFFPSVKHCYATKSASFYKILPETVELSTPKRSVEWKCTSYSVISMCFENCFGSWFVEIIAEITFFGNRFLPNQGLFISET